MPSVTYDVSNIEFVVQRVNGATLPQPQILYGSAQFVWTYDEGNFAGGNGTVTQLVVPFMNSAAASARTTVTTTALSGTLPGNVDNVSFDFIMNFAAPLTSPTQSTTIGSGNFDMTGNENGYAGDFTGPIVGGNVLPEAHCFAAGTLIETDRGDVPVEALQVGDLVRTFQGGVSPVRWIGRRHVDLARHPDPKLARPVRVRRDAVAPGQPRRDLYLSPDHAIFVEGLLVPVRLLVNGATIVPDADCGYATYLHVELDRHAVLFSEGLPTESYRDIGNRSAFAGGDAALTLHPDFGRAETDAAGRHQPLTLDPARVRPVWERLADRAASLGFPLPVIETTSEPDCRLAVRDRLLRPAHRQPGAVVFALQRDARVVRLQCRSAAPSDIEPWREDRRRLGVLVQRILLQGGDGTTSLALDGPCIGSGWWDFDGSARSRWTQGNAMVLLPRPAALITFLFAPCEHRYPAQRPSDHARAA